VSVSFSNMGSLSFIFLKTKLPLVVPLLNTVWVWFPARYVLRARTFPVSVHQVGARGSRWLGASAAQQHAEPTRSRRGRAEPTRSRRGRGRIAVGAFFGPASASLTLTSC
jgi:hypothetical protein